MDLALNNLQRLICHKTKQTWLYSTNCSYGKQTPKPFYRIDARKWWLRANHVEKKTVNENYFYQYINTHEIIYTKKQD